MAYGDNAPTIIIKKVKKGGHGGHHGGAWKVAYADFVTAMMAFFLLMWLINTTSPEQKRGIADYFAPASVSQTTSGSGGILAGTGLSDSGAKTDGSSATPSPAQPETPSTQTDKAAKPGAGGAADAAAQAAQAKAEADEFKSAAESLRQALQDMPELAELSKQVIVDVTPEGLRIQLVDQEGRSMFDQGSAKPNDRARLLLRAVSQVVRQLHNRITVSGHTSAVVGAGAGGDDWALSAARANAARSVLQEAGVEADRIYQVSGKANSDPLYPDDPTLPGNRRIAITLLREKPVLPPDQP
ncbi:flagellar motor protein MotB [Caulobacter sp. S45]|uniref:flagellar motor protein MotB n=1 Tax=Caulobacter sp. S45 TaxID=1641861 RepID=UPI001575B879|nr:flagellar motor protein MotB [Caulobacter sp. S45]